MAEQLGDLDILNQVDETEQESDLSDLQETPEKKEAEETEEATEEVTEEVTEEEDAEEKVEEEPEPDENEEIAQGRLTFKEVSKEFPTLFKKFPALRHAFFKEQEYSKVFPTVEDAQEAHKKATDYAYLERDLLSGEPKQLFSAVAQTSPEAFGKLVSKVLPAIYEVDKDAFYEMTEPILKNALQAAFREGNSSDTQDGKNLALAARYLNKFLFRSTEIGDAQPVIREKTPDPERVKFEQERNQFQEQRFHDFRENIVETIQKELSKLTINGLDPENKLNEFVRKSIIKETIEQIGSVLEKDSRHLATMDSLWKRARLNGLTQEHKARILQTYLGRVKEILPVIRSKVRSTATGETKVKTAIKRPTGTGTGTQSPQPLNPRKVDWNKTSDLDILNDNVKYRK